MLLTNKCVENSRNINMLIKYFELLSMRICYDFRGIKSNEIKNQTRTNLSWGRTAHNTLDHLFIVYHPGLLSPHFKFIHNLLTRTTSERWSCPSLRSGSTLVKPISQFTVHTTRSTSRFAILNSHSISKIQIT